jgi:hypothetical protein
MTRFLIFAGWNIYPLNTLKNGDIIMTALYAFITLIAYLWIFWGLFVIVMGLYRAHLDKRLSRISYALGAPFLAVGWLMDFFANVTIATVVFLEPPKELMVSSRLKRHVESKRGWRYAVSDAICRNLLDVFDPSGNHC